MGDVDIPLCAGELTEPWLLQALRSSGMSQLKSLRIQDVQDNYGNSMGFLSAMVKLRAELKAGEDTVVEDFVVKLLPPDPMARELVLKGGVDMAEIQAYKTLLKDVIEIEAKFGGSYLKESLPRLVYGEYCRKPKPKSILMLEDLKVAGYDCMEFMRGLDLDHMVSAVQFLSNYHAATFALEKHREWDMANVYPFVFDSSTAEEFLTGYVNIGTDLAIDICGRFPDSAGLGDVIRRACKEGLSRISHVMNKKERNYPFTIIHSDYWNNNLMFKRTSDNLLIKVVDWQILSYAPTFVPFAVLFLSSASTECREKHLDEIVDAYWSALVSKCKTFQLPVPGTLQQFKDDLENVGWMQAFIWCIASTVDLFSAKEEHYKRLNEIIVWLHKRRVI